MPRKPKPLEVRTLHGLKKFLSKGRWKSRMVLVALGLIYLWMNPKLLGLDTANTQSAFDTHLLILGLCAVAISILVWTILQLR